eukprot:66974-Pelagomonas_calceolata.AAC.1
MAEGATQLQRQAQAFWGRHTAAGAGIRLAGKVPVRLAVGTITTSRGFVGEVPARLAASALYI